MNQTLSVIILTHNESKHLTRAIEHIRSIASEVFVVDSYSTDETVPMALACGATVLQNQFINYAKQFQWALDNAPIKSDWVMRLDADEIVEPSLAAEIATKLSELPPDVTGVNLNRKTIFAGRWIKYGGRYPLILLRIWRRGKARIEDRWMDEHMILTEGRAVLFRGGFADYNLEDLTFFINKHNKYATREAVDIINRYRSLFALDEDLDTRTTSRQAAAKRYAKETLYNRLPFEIGAFAYFLYRYIVRLGFLDGRDGLIYHFLQGFWYRYLVGAKVRELELALVGLNDPQGIKKELSRRTGLRLFES